MNSKSGMKQGGFTLVEIMIVVSIIGLLVVLVLPSFIKSRKQSQGRRIVNDARQLDSAVDQWAMEYSKKDGDPIDTTGAATYLKAGWKTTDVLGNQFVGKLIIKIGLLLIIGIFILLEIGIFLVGLNLIELG